MTPLIKNCNHFFKHRPPMVIFLLCLISLAVTTFSFAFYIKNDDKIIDTDVLQNWKFLTKFFEKSQLCRSNSTNQPPKLSERASFTTLVKTNLTSFKNFSQINVVYSLKGWQTNCGITNERDVVTMSFAGGKNASRDEVCALITGPKLYLPEYSVPGCRVVFDKNPSVLFFSSESCTERENNPKFIFNPELNWDNFSIFLSQGEKNTVYVHLMWCSFCLVFLTVVLLLYAIFHHHEDTEEKFFY